MSDTKEQLIDRISDLEHELAVKEAELHRYRLELAKANSTLEKLILKSTEELKLAQALQKLLTPTEIPNLPGFEFSTKFLAGSRFGGDYFDLFEHEDKLKFGILISSASGYSLSSLLLAVIIKISGPMEARRGLAAHKVVEALAKEVQPQIQSESKAGLFYGIVDRRNYEMQYCCIGDIDTFLVPGNGSGHQVLQKCGEALTKTSKLEFHSHLVSLNPRDKFVIASEGFKNSVNASGQQWGSDGFKASLQKATKISVHEVRNDILYLNQKFTGREEPERDQTLIVAEVKDAVIKLAKQN